MKKIQFKDAIEAKAELIVSKFKPLDVQSGQILVLAGQFRNQCVIHKDAPEAWNKLRELQKAVGNMYQLFRIEEREE